MSHAIKSTFIDMTEAEFSTYGNDLLDSYTSGFERKQAAAYLQSINSIDSVALQAERVALQTKQLEQRKKQRQIETMLSNHSFDFAKTPALFQTQSAPNNAALTALLATDNSEIYIKGRTHVGDITITANGVLLDGISAGGSARDLELTNTASVLGNIIIDGNNTIIRGIDFTSTGDKAISFATGASNVTFENCKFTAGAGDTTKWYYGQHFGGNVTVTNCLVGD